MVVLRIALLASLAIIQWVNGQTTQKALVLKDGVKASSDLGDGFNGDLSSKTDVKGKYTGGGKGWIKGDKGDVSASGAQKFNAQGPSGGSKDKFTGDYDGKKNIANINSPKGDKIVADASNDKAIKANVNGKQTHEIDRDKSGNIDVWPAGAKKAPYNVKNAVADPPKPGVITNIQGGPQHISRTLVDKDSKGNIENVRNIDSLNTIPGVNFGTRFESKMAYQGQSDSDMTVGESVGNTADNGPAVGGAAGVSSGKTETKACLTNPDGTDYFGKSGFDIDDKSISFELIKDKDGAYTFPSCFNAFAKISIPPGVDAADIAAHATVKSVVAGGEMQCDTSVSCLDRSTANRPRGSCFFCDFCNAKQPQGAFGLTSESNFCTAKAKATLPLKWKICPPTSKYKANYIPFTPSLSSAEGDVVSTVSIYQREKDSKTGKKTWVQKACKQSVYPFRAGLTGAKSVGSKSVANPVGSASDNKWLSNTFGGRR